MLRKLLCLFGFHIYEWKKVIRNSQDIEERHCKYCNEEHPYNYLDCQG